MAPSFSPLGDQIADARATRSRINAPSDVYTVPVAGGAPTWCARPTASRSTRSGPTRSRSARRAPAPGLPAPEHPADEPGRVQQPPAEQRARADTRVRPGAAAVGKRPAAPGDLRRAGHRPGLRRRPQQRRGARPRRRRFNGTAPAAISRDGTMVLAQTGGEGRRARPETSVDPSTGAGHALVRRASTPEWNAKGHLRDACAQRCGTKLGGEEGRANPNHWASRMTPIQRRYRGAIRAWGRGTATEPSYVANKAAFSREDIADEARRSGGLAGLQATPPTRGRQFLDHATRGRGYRTAGPHPEFDFSLIRGPLPGGEFGLVGHEAFGPRGSAARWPGRAGSRPWKAEGHRLGPAISPVMLPGADLFTGWGGEKVGRCARPAPPPPGPNRERGHPARPAHRQPRGRPCLRFGNDGDLDVLGLLLHADPAAPAELLDAFLAEPWRDPPRARGRPAVPGPDHLRDAGRAHAKLDRRRRATRRASGGFASALARNARAACRARLPREPFARRCRRRPGKPARRQARGFALEPHWQEWARAQTAGRFGPRAPEGAPRTTAPSRRCPRPASPRPRCGTPPVLGVFGRLVVPRPSRGASAPP